MKNQKDDVWTSCKHGLNDYSPISITCTFPSPAGRIAGCYSILCIDYIRKHKPNRKLGVFHMDYEVQYNETIRYLDRTLAANPDLLEVYRVCIPFKVSTCTSMYQRYWRPWDDSLRHLWVRELPTGCYCKEDFDFYTEEMWDYDFQVKFAEWFHKKKNAQRTCCLIGIRTQESYHRWQAIHRDKNYHSYKHLKWTHKVAPKHLQRLPDIRLAHHRYLDRKRKIQVGLQSPV